MNKAFSLLELEQIVRWLKCQTGTSFDNRTESPATEGTAGKEGAQRRVHGRAKEEAESLQKQLTIDVRRLQEDAETKKEKLRASFTK